MKIFRMPITWISILCVSLVIVFFIPYLTVPVVTTQVETKCTTEMREAITEEEVTVTEECEETIFDDEEVLVGWGTFGFRSCLIDLTKDDLLVTGTFHVTTERVRYEGKYYKVYQGLPFAVLTKRQHEVCRNFSSIDAVSKPIFLSPYNGLEWSRYGDFSFVPTEPEYFFVFSNRTEFFDRHGELTVKLTWTETRTEVQEKVELTPEEYCEIVENQVITHKKGSLYDIIRD